jgi:hypothetical protein
MSEVRVWNWVLVTEVDKVAIGWWHFLWFLGQYRLLCFLPTL